MKFKHRNSGGRSGIRTILALSLIAGLFTVIAPTAALATEPDHVSQTVEGCNLAKGTFDDSTITCTGAQAYTGGELKGWNELDLVPWRLTTKAGQPAPLTQTFDTGVAVDAFDNGHPGFDVLSAPVLNDALSDASCVLEDVGPETSITPGFGGIDESLGRTLQITQARSSTCVFDYYARLALGSHLFPGASLHGNLSNADLDDTNQDVPIPVKEIAPQELRKTMTAVQNADTSWDIEKDASPAELDFGDTCDPTAPVSLTTDVTITWTKGGAVGGNVLVTTHVYAKNPAHRTITVLVSDDIRSGTTVLDTATNGTGVDVAANTELEVLTHTTTITAAQAVDLNDIATATYIDKVTGIAVPGSTTATATATVQQGTVTNGTASISDVESITGNGFSFSVDGVTGDADALNGDTFNGYTLGTETTSAVTWDSGEVSDSGSVTFAKTVYFAGPGDGSGSLSDTATLTGSDGFSASDSFDVDLSAVTLATLTINKSIAAPADGDLTFTFEVRDDQDNLVGTVDVDIADGETDGSGTLGGLEDGDYTIDEAAQNGYAAQTGIKFTVEAGQCDVSVDVTNGFDPASAQAIKVTVPDGSQANWEMILDGPGTPSGGEKVLTDSGGFAGFVTQLEEGAYTITETNQDGWTSDGGVGDCSFTVDYPADAGNLYSCTFTNTAQGNIIIEKVTDPASDTTTQFEFDSDYGDNFFLKNGESNDSGGLDAGTYAVSEVNLPANWALTSAVCDDGSLVSAIDLEAGETVTCTFTNTFTQPSGGLTMGYWRTHLAPDTAANRSICRGLPQGTSCSKNGPWTSQYLPQLLGNYPVDTIAKAAAVFKAADCGTSGDKSAVNCLAGQLLAAELNLANGADSCIQDVVDDANAFLISIGYAGPGPKYTLTAAQRVQAIDLKTALDEYNNGACS
jgi:hypothetical protein